MQAGTRNVVNKVQERGEKIEPSSGQWERIAGENIVWPQYCFSSQEERAGVRKKTKARFLDASEIVKRKFIQFIESRGN